MHIASSWDDPDTFVAIMTDRIKYPDPKFNIVIRIACEKRVPRPTKETFCTPHRGSQRANHLGRLYTRSMILMAYFERVFGHAEPSWYPKDTVHQTKCRGTRKFRKFMISGRNGTSRTWEGTGYSQRSSRDIAIHNFGGAGHCKTYNIWEKQHIRKNSGGESANLEEAWYQGETAHPDNSTVLLLLALVLVLLLLASLS